MSNAAISETDLWEWLKAGAEPEFRRNLHLSRIENLVGVGDPDVRGTLFGSTFDIELKTAARPARPSTQVLNPNSEYIRAAQKVWHRLNWLAGGSCFVLLQIGSKVAAKYYMIPGKFISVIEGKTEDELRELSLEHPFLTCPESIVKTAATYRSTLREGLREYAGRPV